jgi:hypothetical protein
MKCQTGCDLVGLAERTWSVDSTEAIAKIKSFGIPMYAPEYDPLRPRILLARTRALDFWKNASSRPISGSLDVATLVGQFGWRCRAPQERRAETVGSLYGWSSSSDLEALNPYGESPHDFSFRDATSGWGDCLILPFHDLPGRICGMLAIGKKEGKVEYYYKRLNVSGPDSRGGTHSPVIEAGLCMHPLAVFSGRRWHYRMIATRNAELAIRLQCMQLENDPMPLPLAIWQNNRYGRLAQKISTNNSWSQLYRRRVTFWMPEPCGVTMAEAIKRNAYVSTCSPPGGIDWDTYLGFRHPEDITASIFNVSKGWNRALCEALLKMEEWQLEEFLADMEESGVVPGSLDLPAQIKAIIDKHVEGPSRLKTVSFRGMTIMSQDDSWYRLSGKNKPELISDASLEITHAIHQPNEGRIVYKGFIGYHGEKIPFAAPQNDIQNYAMSFVRETLLKNRKGIITFPGGYDSIGLHIAMQFSKPEYVTGLDRTGWDEVSRKFVFPSFSISLGGGVETHDRSFFLEGSPCWDWKEPNGVSAADAELIPGALGWALTAAIASSFVAKSIPGWTQQSIGLRGIGAMQAARQVVSHYGSKFIKIGPAIRSRKMAAPLAARHDMPSYIENPPAEGGGTLESATSFLKWLTSSSPNAFVPLNNWQGLSKMMDEEWLAIRCQQPINVTQLSVEGMANVIANYLKDLCSRYLELPDDESQVLSVLQDMKGFLSKNSIPNKLDEAVGLLMGCSSSGRCDAFAEMLSEFILGTNIRYSSEAGARNSIWQDEGELYIPKKTFCTAVAKKSGISPKHIGVTNILAGGKRLIGETESCWIVDFKWWSDFHKQHAALEKKMLRIVG